jgi:preprotein translocase subunit SecB
LLDNYVKELSINCDNKIELNEKINYDGQIGYKIVNIYRSDDALLGQVEFCNDICINLENDKMAKIHVCMIGLFKTDKDEDEEVFKEMLKYNGAPTLSHLTRAHINAVTAISGMPPVITPMINFMEFFKDSNKIE